ncbi:MAG TPA: transposase [Blastocatellia bacterium]|nr:transposase [Blastocatellia bacterium]
MKKRPSNSSVRQAKTARRKYDEEFKRQALTMIRNGQSVRSVAQALGISENLLHQWKRAARADQSDAELEIEQLRQRLKQVEMERDILKKALSIFSRQT